MHLNTYINIGYLDTGLLFFHDRWHYGGGRHLKNLKQVITENIPDFDYTNTSLIGRFKNYNKLSVSTAVANRPASLPLIDLKTITEQESSGNLFMRALHNETARNSDHYQDSSVVLVDRSRHTEYLKVIQYLLPTFNAGYGDKELFWVSATIASIPYAFSPYLAGSMASESAKSTILHYDPLDEAYTSSSDSISIQHEKDMNSIPLYINAEDFIERIMFVGHNFRPVISQKVKVSFDMVLEPVRMLGKICISSTSNVI